MTESCYWELFHIFGTLFKKYNILVSPYSFFPQVYLGYIGSNVHCGSRRISVLVFTKVLRGAYYNMCSFVREQDVGTSVSGRYIL